MALGCTDTPLVSRPRFEVAPGIGKFRDFPTETREIPKKINFLKIKKSLFLEKIFLDKYSFLVYHDQSLTIL